MNKKKKTEIEETHEIEITLTFMRELSENVHVHCMTLYRFPFALFLNLCRESEI